MSAIPADQIAVVDRLVALGYTWHDALQAVQEAWQDPDHPKGIGEKRVIYNPGAGERRWEIWQLVTDPPVPFQQALAAVASDRSEDLAGDGQPS